jgi:hypothetical protein
MSEKPTCGNCRFKRRHKVFDGANYAEADVCAWRPPVIVMSLIEPTGLPATTWPAIDLGEWCGKWDPSSEFVQRRIDKQTGKQA